MDKTPTWQTINVATQSGIEPQTRKGTEIVLNDGVRYFLTLAPYNTSVHLSHYATGQLVDQEDLSLGRVTPQQLLDRIGSERVAQAAGVQPTLNPLPIHIGNGSCSGYLGGGSTCTLTVRGVVDPDTL